MKMKMQYKCFEKIIALILSACILFSAASMYISAEIMNDGASIEVVGDKVILNLEFANTYYNTQNTGYSDVNDFRGKSLALTNEALEEYNTSNATTLTIEDITDMKVSTADSVYLCGQFSTFIKEKLPQVIEIDLSDANVTTRNYKWESSGYTDNAMPSGFFGTYSGTVKIPNIKKIVLPDSLEVLKDYVFKNLTTLETIVFGNSLKTIGYEAFQNCSSLKALNFPDSLKEFTSNAKYYITGCSSLLEVSYHGSAEGATDIAAFYNKLYEIIKPNTVTKVDLSGSGITTLDALNVANKTTLESIDISNCANVEYDSPNGVLLYERLLSLKDSNVVVNMPTKPSTNVEDIGVIEVEGSTVTLTLSFVTTYYDTQSSGYDDINDIRGKSLELTNSALSKYNNDNSTAYTLSEIDVLKVGTSDKVYLTGRFVNFIKEKLPQITEIDMSNANVTTRNYKWESSGYTDNALQSGYFGTYSGTVKFPNIKKIILPDSLEVLKDYVFKNLTTLETIEFGSSLKTIGYEAFQNCSSLKALNFPDSLNEFTSNASYYTVGCTSLKEIKYNGIALGTSDIATFYEKLVKLVPSTVTSIDFSNSGIGSEDALVVAKLNGLTYINLSGCTNIEYNSVSGVLLYDRLITLKNQGVTVLMPENLSDDSNEPADTGVITVEGKEVILTLDFIKTYYDTQSTSYDDPNDIRGISLMLADVALKVYNRSNATDYSLSDITNLTVKCADDVYVTKQFVTFIKEKIPQVTTIDLKDANVTTRTYAWETSNYQDNTLPDQYFGTYSTAPKLTNIKKIVLPDSLEVLKSYIFKNLTTLETIVFGANFKSIDGYETFQNCTSLKNVDYPDSIIKIYDTKVYEKVYTQTLGSGIEGWSFHGLATEADDINAFFTNLVNSFSNINYKRVDLSGSAITASEALLIKDDIDYLDLRNCFNLEYSSEDGLKLYDKLVALINSGATVYMPSKEELDAKFLVTVMSSDKTMGLVRGTKVFDKTDVPVNHTITAIPNDGYELVGWQVDGESELRAPGMPDSDGNHKLTLSITGTLTITAVFEIKATNIPSENKVILGSNGKLDIILNDINDDAQISTYTQILLKNLKVQTGKQYYARDILSIKISTAAGVKLKKSLEEIFPSGFFKELKENLKKIDISKVTFVSNEIPSGYVMEFSALSEVILPENLESTGYQSFRYCTSLKKIDLPETVTTIGSACFRYSGLEEIKLPNGIKRIEVAAFGNCENFTGTVGSKVGIFKIPDGIEKWSSLWGEISVINTANLYNDSGTQWMFINTKVTGIEFHGEGNPASFSRMIAVLDWKNGYYDFKGSGITEKQLAVIPFTTAPKGEKRTTYLDIRDCPIDYTTARGKALKKKLERYIAENPDVTILWDDGIIRDTSYTVVEASIEISGNETMEQALEKWSIANNNVQVSTITDLTIKTLGDRELTKEDCETLKSVMLMSLRKLYLSNASFDNDTIPDEAFKGAENLTLLELPEGIKNIGKYAFSATNLMCVSLPYTIEFLDDYAFSECFSMEGELILPNGLKNIGTGVFVDSGFTKLVYHGPVDINISKNFTYALETVEYLDLRGCTGITEKNFPTGWNALKVANLDYCSMDGALNGDFYWKLIVLINRHPLIITLSNQCVEYDDLDAMLAEFLYGKSQKDYPNDCKDSVDYNTDVFGLLDVDEIEYLLLDNEDNNDNYENSEAQNSEISQDNGNKVVKKKKVVVTKRRKKATSSNNFSWIIYVALAVIVVAGAITTWIVLLKRKKKKLM